MLFDAQMQNDVLKNPFFNPLLKKVAGRVIPNNYPKNRSICLQAKSFAF